MSSDFVMDAAAERRLEQYLGAIGQVLNNKRRRASFAMYAMGILGDAERESAEPIAARACGDPRLANAYHQRLLEFLSESTWSDHQVRRLAANYAVHEMAAREPVSAWIVDDTGFLKQGKHSVGVQRQYTGSAGKVTNCQIGVSLSLATKTEHVAVDFELYLPKTWAEDPQRRKQARIPDEVVFETKADLALNMLRWAIEDGLPKAVVLADSAYGDSSAFRDGMRGLGLDYAVGVHGPTKVWRLDKLARRRGEPLSVAELGLQLSRSRFRRVTWREGTKQALWSRFACERVVPAHDDGWDPAVREAVWLVIEWPDGEPEPTKHVFATLPPSYRRKQLVRLIKERYRTERLYQDLKGELGLDHFEGRSFPGWHHHVSVVLSCYAFVVAERVRRFPPSARRPRRHRAVPIAA
jgi:SRSO17 transposase